MREAEVCIMSPHYRAIPAYAFNKGGRDAVIGIVENGNYESIKNMAPELYDGTIRVFPKTLPEVALMTDDNMEELAKKSSAFRKTVRGEAIGALGQIWRCMITKVGKADMVNMHQ